MNSLQPGGVSTQLALTLVQYFSLFHPREQRFGRSKGRLSSGRAAPNTRAAAAVCHPGNVSVPDRSRKENHPLRGSEGRRPFRGAAREHPWAPAGRCRNVYKTNRSGGSSQLSQLSSQEKFSQRSSKVPLKLWKRHYFYITTAIFKITYQSQTEHLNISEPY